MKPEDITRTASDDFMQQMPLEGITQTASALSGLQIVCFNVFQGLLIFV